MLICNNTCNNDFFFCINEPNTNVPNCMRTGLVANDSLVFGSTIGERNLSNPFTFNGTEWPFVNDTVRVLICVVVDVLL